MVEHLKKNIQVDMVDIQTGEILATCKRCLSVGFPTDEGTKYLSQQLSNISDYANSKGDIAMLITISHPKIVETDCFSARLSIVNHRNKVCVLTRNS